MRIDLERDLRRSVEYARLRRTPADGELITAYLGDHRRDIVHGIPELECRGRARHRKLFPADIRPQAHDIIRTWAFYTIVKAALHEHTIPWRHALISGFIMDPDRKKMSKSKGNVITPVEYLQRYTADGVRYWAASVGLGTDTAFDEGVMRNGRRLVIKLYNAGRFVLSLAAGPGAVTEPLDRAFLRKLRDLVSRATAVYEQFEFPLGEIEGFFWHDFTDTFIELVKARARAGTEAGGSAVAALRRGLGILLRLFAPILPYITEEVWSWAYAREEGPESIHVASWPSEQELSDLDPRAEARCFDAAKGALSAINKAKTLAGVALGRQIRCQTLQPAFATLPSGRACTYSSIGPNRVQNGLWLP